MTSRLPSSSIGRRGSRGGGARTVSIVVGVDPECHATTLSVIDGCSVYVTFPFMVAGGGGVLAEGGKAMRPAVVQFVLTSSI